MNSAEHFVAIMDNEWIHLSS